jgi:hypothetical protein
LPCRAAPCRSTIDCVSETIRSLLREKGLKSVDSHFFRSLVLLGVAFAVVLLGLLLPPPSSTPDDAAGERPATAGWLSGTTAALQPLTFL